MNNNENVGGRMKNSHSVGLKGLFHYIFESIQSFVPCYYFLQQIICHTLTI